MTIHPTAIVSDRASITNPIEIGPYSIVGPHVTIGEGCRIGAHAIIEGHTTLGTNNTVHHHAVIGGPPQDQKYDGSPTQLIIGNNNQFREFCSIHRGTQKDNGRTQIGSGNLIMANAHVAHDCIVGDRCVIANSVALAGHVSIGNDVVLGGLCAVHQFTRIGDGAILSGGAMATQDVPPFTIAQGDRARLRGLNRVGLRRVGIPTESITLLSKAYKIIFLSDLNFQKALMDAKTQLPQDPVLDRFLEFMAHSSRGICRASL